jgi:hypothetical protein
VADRGLPQHDGCPVLATAKMRSARATPTANGWCSVATYVRSGSNSTNLRVSITRPLSGTSRPPRRHGLIEPDCRAMIQMLDRPKTGAARCSYAPLWIGRCFFAASVQETGLALSARSRSARCAAKRLPTALPASSSRRLRCARASRSFRTSRPCRHRPHRAHGRSGRCHRAARSAGFSGGTAPIASSVFNARCGAITLSPKEKAALRRRTHDDSSLGRGLINRVPHGRTGRRLTSAMSFKMARKRTFLEVRVGSIASPAASHFQPPPINGHRQSGPVGPFRANRRTE